MLRRFYALSPHARLESRDGVTVLLCRHPLLVLRLNDAAARLLGALRPGLSLDALAEGLTPQVLRYLDDLVALGALRAACHVDPAPPRDPPHKSAAPPSGDLPPSGVTPADHHAPADFGAPGDIGAPGDFCGRGDFRETVEVVIPVLNNPRGLGHCLEGLALQQQHRLEEVSALGRAATPLRVTVVDDGSEPPLRLPPVPAALRVRLLRLPVNRGPASARNHAVRTPWEDAPFGHGERIPSGWLAFLDSDCVPDPDWLAGLWAVLGPGAAPGDGSSAPAVDSRADIAAVGGPVRPLRGDSVLGRYEGACSSLVLGERPGAVGGRRDAMAYMPTCNLAVRREAFEAVGGFREGWRFGEDVDLCWRLADSGRLLFYLGGTSHGNSAGGGVRHDFRTRPGAFMQRRRLYARSETPLRAAHPERFGRGVPPWLLPGALALALLPPVGMAVTPHAGMGVLPVLGAALALWLAGGLVALLWGLRSPPTEGSDHGKGSGDGLRKGWRLRALGRFVPGAVPRMTAGALVQGARRAWRTTGVLWLALLAAALAAAAGCGTPGVDREQGCGGLWFAEGAWGVWLLGGGVFALAALGEALARRRAGVRLPPWPVFLGGLLLDGAAYSLGWLEGRMGGLARRKQGARRGGRGGRQRWERRPGRRTLLWGRPKRIKS